VPPGGRTVICHDCHQAVNVVADAQTVNEPPSAGESTATDAPTLSTTRVRFNCPECHEELTVPAGRPLEKCPACGASLLGLDQGLPTSGEAEPATAPTVQTARATRPTAPRSTRRELQLRKNVEWMREHFAGRYEIIEFVKSGGMGAVYKARQLRPSRIVALKVLLGGHFATESQLKRFEREAQAVAMLNHPAIVPVYEYGEVDGQPYFTMEFVEGTDLRTYAVEKNLSRQEICRQMARVCDAIQYAHEHGVIHRDLKPGNIMVDALDRPRILDFGLSRASVGDEEEERLTMTGEYLGTPRYMSPEQAMGRPKGVDERTDVFALGVILFEMIVGVIPYPVEHVRGLKMVEVLSTWDPLRPSALRPDIPRDLELILLKAVARDKRERYQSAREFGEDLENWLAGRPISARPATLEYRLNRWIWRHRKVLAPAAVAALLLTAVSGYYALRLRQERLAREVRDHRIAQLEPIEQRYMQSFRTGRQAVEQAIRHGMWQRAHAVAELAPSFWAGEEGVEQLAREVRRAAERLTRRQTEAYRDAIRGQQYAEAQRVAAEMSELALQMPYDDLRSTLARAAAEFEADCWQELQDSLNRAYTPQQVRAHVDAFLRALPDSPHAGKARALAAELEAKPADYFLRRHELAFERAMDARRWQEAEAVIESGTRADDAKNDRWQARLKDMKARLRAVIRRSTAPDLAPLARIDQGGIVYDLDFAPDGRLLAAVSGRRPIGLWNPRTGQAAGALEQGRILRRVALSPDGLRLAAGAEDGTLEVWSLASGRMERELTGHAGRIRSLSFTPDGRRLLSADRGAVILWDLETGDRVEVPNMSGSAPAAISPDGDIVAAAGEAGVALWELATGLPLLSIATGTSPVTMVFSPDSALLATAHTEPAGRRVRLWRVESGTKTAELTVRVGPETLYEKLNWALAFSPDGALLATGDVDGNLKVWEVAGGKELFTYGMPSVPRCMAFSPDSRMLAVGLTDGAVVMLGVRGAAREQTGEGAD